MRHEQGLRTWIREGVELWPRELRDRDPAALRTARKECCDQLEKVKFWQHLFFRQWQALKACCEEKGIRLLGGDLAIYVSLGS